MGVFFRSEPVAPLVQTALRDAFKTDPKTVPDLEQTATEEAKKVANKVRGEFAWVRLGVAVAFFVAIFFAAIYTGRDDELQDLYRILLQFLEVLLPAIVGLITGEAIGRG